MKKISVVIPCYNEENSVIEMYERLTSIFGNQLPQYDYEIIYVDDFSTDKTREKIREICTKDKKVKAYFNAKNFGFHRNVFSALQYGIGDAVFLLFGDLQDPPEKLVDFVKHWEEGHKVVIGQKKHSDEGFVMTCCRRIYYKVINALSDTEQIEMYNGFGLYDRSFIDTIKDIDDVSPYLKQVILEYAPDMYIEKYDHAESMRGKSNFNFMKNYDFAMQGITSSTKLLLRMATFIGAILGVVCLLIAIWVFVHKLLNWEAYPAGMASVLIGVFMVGAVQLFFIGILGEYVLSINTKVVKKPRVVIGETINVEEEFED